MRTLLFAILLLAVLLPTGAGAASLTVSWDANTEEDLAGYRVHLGTAPRSYTERIVVMAPATSLEAKQLLPGTAYYGAVTAFDTSGNESDLSEECSATTLGLPGGDPSDTAPPGRVRGPAMALPAPVFSGP